MDGDLVRGQDDGYRPASTDKHPETMSVETAVAMSVETAVAMSVEPTMALSPPLTNVDEPTPQQPSKDNCDRRRPEEQDLSRLVEMPSDLVGTTVTPFLKEHIPSIYAPVGKPLPDDGNAEADKALRAKDPNTKYCYRHRPDSKCRRAADETKMGIIQRELNSLSTADQQAITHVWSLFSAAPHRHRNLMLQGVITMACFPELSALSREVHEQLKIDFLTALPAEISYKILSFLDPVSLCKAAQVSRRWRDLSDDDVVWHRMCEQHIDRKCTKCGWGLPLLERKKLRAWTRHHQSHHRSAEVTEIEVEDEPESTPSRDSQKRAIVVREDSPAKRPRLGAPSTSQLEVERKFRPWKDVYRDRFKVGYNWKTGRCSIKTFRGHENGITTIQFADNILATGSYDATVKIWDIETGEVIRTLQGHTSTIRTLQFDDSKLISGSFDKTIKIWNWQTGECLSTLQCHTDGVLSVHFDGGTLASGSIDKTVKIFQFGTKQTFCLRGHTDWVNHVRLDPVSRTVFSASDDLTLKLWDLDTKQCLKTFKGHVGQVQQVILMPPEFEPDEIHASGSGDNGDTASAHSGRSNSPTPPATYTTASQELEDRASFGPTFMRDPERPLPPRYMLSGGLDNTIRLWDTVSGKCIRSMFGHVEGIWGLNADGLRIISAANDSMVKVWEASSGVCERSFTGHTGPVTCVHLSDSRMASGSEDGEVRLYSFEGEAVEERGTPS